MVGPQTPIIMGIVFTVAIDRVDDNRHSQLFERF